MWVITVYTNEGIKMFEFESEAEAKAMYKGLSGSKVLSEVIYYNDPCFAAVG